MNKYFETELSKWIPRLSGAAFKCLFVIYLEIAVAGSPEVVIARRHFVAETGLSKSAVQAALAEIVAARAAVRRPTKGGSFAYSVPGLIISRDENQPGRKSIRVENQSSRPTDLFDLFLWHWQKRFDGKKLPEIPAPVKSEIIALIEQYSYKYLLRSLKGLATLGDFDVVKDVLNPETTVKSVRRRNFLYFSWRDSRTTGGGE